MASNVSAAARRARLSRSFPACAPFSPSTGIVDSHALMLANQAEVEAAGGMAVLRAPVVAGRVTERGFALEGGGAEPMVLECRMLVNSAGVHAPGLGGPIPGIPASTIPPPTFC